MPSLAQGYGRGLMLGLQLQDAERQRGWDELRQSLLSEQIEDIREERKRKKGILDTISKFPELQGAFGLAEAGVPWGTAKEATGYVPPAEQKKQTMMGDLTQLQSVYGQGIVPGILGHHNVPTETKGRMAGMFPLKQMFPGMYPEEEKKATPTATAKNLAAKYQRFKEWYVETYGATSEEEIKKAWRKKEFDEKAKGTKKKEPSLAALKSIVEDYSIPEEQRGLAEQELERRKEAAVRQISPGYGLPPKTARQSTPVEGVSGIPGVPPEKPKKQVETKESILSGFKSAGIKRINAMGLKGDYPWLTEEDLNWIIGNL